MKTGTDCPQERIPKPMERYQHFRGGRYQVLMLAEKEDTGEQLVIYQALYGDNKVYARSLSSFLEELDPVRYPDAVQRFRFQKMEEAEAPDEARLNGDLNGTPNGNDTPGSESGAESKEEAEPPLDPMLERFLDARTTQERLTVLDEIRGRVTDSMIDTMALASDVEVKPGPLQLRYEDLHDCLLTIQRYELERSRLRG